MNDFHKLVEICKNRNIYIQTHNFPDPDAIGSAFALQRLLEYFDVASTICCAGGCDKLSVSKMLDYFDIQLAACKEDFWERKNEIEESHLHNKNDCECDSCRIEKETINCALCSKMKAEDAIICVDSQKHGGNVKEFAGNVIACIDHHPTFADAEYEYEEICVTGSCTTLIAKYYQELGIVPKQDEATAMLYGLRMDTLQFTRGVTSLDIEMFGFLFPFCDQQKLFQLEHNNMCLKDLQAYGAVIDSIVIYGAIGFAEIPFACPDGLVATMSDFILDLEEVAIAVVCCNRADGIKLSVRSELPMIHAGYLIHEALKDIGDGGGHQQMAGGMVKAEVFERMQNPEQLIRDRFLNVFEKMRCLS